MKKDELHRILTSVRLLTEDDITSTMQGELEDLFVSPGLKHMLGLLLGSRQAFYLQLSMISLADPVQVARASVLQGKIQGIDLVRETLLDLSTPADADTQGA